MDKPSILSAPKLFDNFESVNTPFHIIAIASILTLIQLQEFDSGHLAPLQWNLIVITISIVILISIIFSSFKHPVDPIKYKLQIKLARSVGIASAILCFWIAGADALNITKVFYKIYIPVIAQIILFGFYILIINRTEETKNITAGIDTQGKVNKIEENDKILKRPSFLQLALITTALLVGIAKNANDGARYYIVSVEGENNTQGHSKEDFQDDLTKGDHTEDESAEENYSEDHTKEVNVEKEICADNRCRKKRYETVDQILFWFWMLCVLIWAYNLIKYLKPGLIFSDKVD